MLERLHRNGLATLLLPLVAGLACTPDVHVTVIVTDAAVSDGGGTGGAGGSGSGGGGGDQVARDATRPRDAEPPPPRDAAPPEPDACVPGSTGCTCLDGESPCAALTDVCDPGTHQCVPDDCIDGNVGCPCLDGEEPCADLDARCGASGLCETIPPDMGTSPPGQDAGCRPGERGCICALGGRCLDDTADICDLRTAQCRERGPAQGERNGACFENSTCGQSDDGVQLFCGVLGTCIEPMCPPGRLGCGCGPAIACDEGLVCGPDPSIQDRLTCQQPDCQPGAPGCACPPDNVCESAGGVDYACDGVRCVERGGCDLGAESCFCRPDYGCAAGLACDDTTFTCVVPADRRGTIGGPCRTDGTCHDPSAQCTLVGGNQICVSQIDCVPGTLNCPCLDGSLCNRPANAGDELVCNAHNRCVSINIRPGELAQPCREDGSCDDGLACNAQICIIAPAPAEEGGPGDVSAEASIPAIDDLCYTPCQTSFEDATGAYRRCESDGLMEGCIAQETAGPNNTVVRTPRECRAAACLIRGETAINCLAGGNGAPDDSLCPDHQRCFPDGHCASNCRTNADCADAGLVCSRHVCRTACTADSPAICGAGRFCEVADGVNGICRFASPTEDGAVRINGVDGQLGLSAGALELSNITQAGAFTVTNESPFSVTVTIHREMTDPATRTPVAEASAFPWVHLSTPDARERADRTLQFSLPSGQSAQVTVADARPAPNITPRIWSGALRLEAQGLRPDQALGSRRVTLSYVESPDGQWTGKAVYFADFKAGSGLEDWLARGRQGALPPNALLQKLQEFKTDASFKLSSFDAMLSSIENESWSFASTREACSDENRQLGANAYCYLYASQDAPQVPQDGAGTVVFTLDDEVNAIPKGPIELPFAMNLRFNPQRPTELLGRIESSLALQYAGNPAVTLRLATDPSLPIQQSCLAAHPESCVVPLSTFEASAAVGGRYLPAAGAACAGGTSATDLPWLVPGFLRGTQELQGIDGLWRSECRSAALPWPGGDAEDVAQNLNFALANPVPDGRARARTVELIDGALIDQRRLFIVFRERFGSFLGDAGVDADPDGFTAYGYLDLQRAETDLSGADNPFQGNVQVDPSPNAVSQLAALGDRCDPVLMQTIADPEPAALPQSGAGVDRRVRALIDGVVSAPVANMFIGPQDGEEVHYVCHQTGRFDDCGTAPGERLSECPAGSGVTYFSVDKAAAAGHELCDDPCNARGTCAELVPPGDGPGGSVEAPELTPFMSRFSIVGNPFWRCVAGPNGAERVVCTDNPADWREGKEFYKRSLVNAPKLQPLLSAIDDAFRYKTRFRSRDGSQVGFAPQVCTGDSGALQYCYEPETIEELSLRMECLLAMYSNDTARARLAATAPTTLTKLRAVLTEAFAKHEEIDPRTGFCTNCRDGFEKLNAELLIMQGDEAFTRALSTRFDLAGVRSGVFPGEHFEVGGINLAGIAGYEMMQLHLSAQYHQMALDRFYRLSRMLWHTMRGPARQPPDATLVSLVGLASVTEYFAKLTTASARKAQAWSTIAQRYQEFNEPDLARRVIERTYAGTYLESVIFSRIMLLLDGVAAPADRRQIQRVMQEAQWQFSRALRLMREAYEGISDDRQIFGFAPDYIPFPALEPGDTNAFDELMATARLRAQDAAEKEDRAINESRQFNVDRVAFEQELAQLADGQESQLADICGTFTGENGRVYPAIAKYALQSAFATALGDPCGLVGNGTFHQKLGELELKHNELRSLVDDHGRKLQQIELLADRAEARCDQIQRDADISFRSAQGEIRLTRYIQTQQLIVEQANRLVAKGTKLADYIKCTVGTSSDCGTAAAAASAYISTWSVQEAMTKVAELNRQRVENDMAVLRADQARDAALRQCDDVQVQLKQDIRSEMLALGGYGLDLARLDIEIQLKRAEIVALRNEAKRLQTEASENERLRIDVEAARNDPNTRIYKNDAVVAADRTFRSAVQAAYKATKVYEFYTSQSYGALQDLFLVRMITRGQPSLEEYLDGLDQAYEEFQEQYGNPDTRVMRISLRDDILQIPRTNPDDGDVRSQRDRIDEFRAAITDPKWISSDGYRTIPFDTKLGLLSPLTRVHKILGIEADIRGAETGDEVGRVYVRQRGTSTVSPVAGRLQYFRLPERIAVINPYFNGRKLFEPTLYRNERLRDRPLVNTRWELVFNDRDEAVNRDIDLNRLDDIVLFVFYTDFTAQE